MPQRTKKTVGTRKLLMTHAKRWCVFLIYCVQLVSIVEGSMAVAMLGGET
jgi:hypothetical protein